MNTMDVIFQALYILKVLEIEEQRRLAELRASLNTLVLGGCRRLMHEIFIKFKKLDNNKK